MRFFHYQMDSPGRAGTPFENSLKIYRDRQIWLPSMKRGWWCSLAWYSTRSLAELWWRLQQEGHLTDALWRRRSAPPPGCSSSWAKGRSRVAVSSTICMAFSSSSTSWSSAAQRSPSGALSCGKGDDITLWYWMGRSEKVCGENAMDWMNEGV